MFSETANVIVNCFKLTCFIAEVRLHGSCFTCTIVYNRCILKMPMQFSATITESGFKSNIWHYMSTPEVNNTLSDVLALPNKCVHLKLSLVDAMIYYSSRVFKILWKPLCNRILRPRTILLFPKSSSLLSHRKEIRDKRT